MVDNKQYIIMDFPFTQKDFASIALQNGKILSCHKNLPIQIKYSGDRAECVILGYAFQADPDRKPPLEELEGLNDDADVDAIVESWAGRWLLIRNDRIYMDACGLLGCYYTDGGILSSSVNCINQVLGKKNRKARLRHGFGLDYYPGPDTQYPYIKRLMPSQIYCMNDNTTGKRKMVSENLSLESDPERIREFLKGFSAIVEDMQRNYKGKFMVPLTGGYDSRTLIALLEYCNLDYTIFTMEHSNITKDDKELPPLLAKKIGRPYRYIARPANADPERYKEYDRHCGYMALDEDRNFYAFSQYPQGTEPAAVLRANIWECAWGHYYAKLKDYGYDRKRFEKKYVNIRGRKDLQKSLAAWLDYAKMDEQRIDPANRFYWEQRMGCWLSGIEQSLTVIENMDSIPLCNCGRLLSILLSFDLEERKEKKHQVKIIERTCPELLEIPFAQNAAAPDGWAERIKKDFCYIYNCMTCLDISSGYREAWKYLSKKVKKKKRK